MGTCYRIIDHTNKLYYDMDKWSVTEEALQSPEALIAYMTEGIARDSWQIQMAEAVVRDVKKYMAFPLVYATDTGGSDDFDEAGANYRQCGDRFWSYHGIWSPFDPLPVGSGTYLVWDKDPCSASKNWCEARYFNGRQWCDVNHLPLALHSPFWWAQHDNAYGLENIK
jgi:hypothetical protein